MASAYGGHATLPTVSASAEVNSCSGLSLTNNTTLTAPPPSNQNNNNSSSHSSSLRQQDEQMHLVETDHNTSSPLMGQQQRLQQNDLLNSNNHPQQQQHLHSGISITENLTNGEGRSMQSFTINSLNGRCSPTASGSSGGGSRSSAHSLPSHSPALHLSNHNAQLTAAYQTQQGSLDACGPTTVVTSAAIMGRLTAGCVDSLGNAGTNAATAGFNTLDGCGNDTLSLLQHHHHHAPSHHFSYSTLTPPHHHHPLHHHHHPHNHHHHHPHDAPGLLDISTL
ncbi:MOB kinase activator-like 2 [Lucilia sericata]|uniref:MOB kinase activator-like 2 n=1 Tax=Lucilia sericata TaxID=13632 RepID=UPI0018A835B0|nr:MOB kinase activator-like 2 [Lucilia sericata]